MGPGGEGLELDAVCGEVMSKRYCPQRLWVVSSNREPLVVTSSEEEAQRFVRYRKREFSEDGPGFQWDVKAVPTLGLTAVLGIEVRDGP